MDYYQEQALKIAAFVKRVGLYELSLCDGCVCGGFEVKGINVDIACGKGRDRAVWVYPAHNGYFEQSGDERLRPIADEVVRQMAEINDRGPVSIFLHEWTK